jgi:ribonuclease G
MAKNILVISCEARETRVALIEDGIIAELHLERKGMTPKGGSVGDVYLGKVTRVLPGLQAAFIDIGLERAAFLHVEDLIRPDDFETYLAGGRKHARGEEGAEAAPPTEADADEADAAAATAALEAPTGEATPILAEGGAQAPEGDGAAEEISVDAPLVEITGGVELASETDADDDEDDDGDEDDRPSGVLPISDDAIVADRASVPEPAATDPLMAAADVPSAAILDDPPSTPELPAAPRAKFDDLLDNPDLPGFTIHDPNEPAPRAPAPRADGGRGGGDRGRGRRRGRGRSGGGGGGDRGPGRSNDRGPSRGADGRDRPNDRRPGGGGRDRNNGGAPARLSKTTPIRDVVKEGQDIIVQVTKEPIGTKGARCSSHISLAGRYVVYMPTVEHVGVSKRIGSDSERARLREAIDSMKPPTGGLIVRTVAEGLTKKQLKQDVGYLVRLWGEVAKNREGAKAPHLLSSELDLVLKCARDLFTDDVEQLVIDDKGQYQRLVSFVEAFMPERLKDIVFYDEDEPIFDAYGIQDEIGRALSRKVPLPSGGYLVIDQAEALTAIDVNTGRFVGKGSKDMEETILKTNLEAVHEIAYQLRFRNIGGLIILDLIDMERSANREKVRRKLEDLLQKDKAKTSLNRISDLGLIEMTRKRTRESLGRLMNEPCFYCDGTGQLQSKETIAYEILREIRRRKADLPGYTVLINCHPAVADLLQGAEKLALQDAENRFMRKINVNPRTEYHLEQFDIVGK